MRRSYFLGLLVVGSALLLAGCSKKPPVVVVQPPDSQQPGVPANPAPPGDGSAPAVASANLDLGLPSGKQEKYDGRLRASLNALAERKYSDALSMLEAAQEI